jgi:CheY-like chemotaxis protein/uncharacterized coiled-coil protein SlyX
MIGVRAALPAMLTAYTAAVFGLTIADVLGLLKSHNFTSACGSLAATAALLLNMYRRGKDRKEAEQEARIRDLEQTVSFQNSTVGALQTLAETNHSLIQNQDQALSREQTARMAMEAELAQVSEEILRRSDVLAAHSGDREPIRPTVPPVSCDVLVIDDDAMVLKSMARILERHGFRVETARSIAEAWSLVAARDATGRRYDFAVMDLVLPDGPVDDVLRLAGEILPGTDVIIVTGVPDPVVLDRAKAISTRVLVKPIELDELLDLLGVPDPRVRP